jgi:hypothetical protein
MEVMLDSFSSNKETGSYVNLQKRIFQRVRSSEVENQIFETVRKFYEDAINEENIDLSSAERKRLLSQILKLILEDLNNKLGEGSIPT